MLELPNSEVAQLSQLSCTAFACPSPRTAATAATARTEHKICDATADVGRSRDFRLAQNFRRVVVRYERYAENFLGMLRLGCCLILLITYEMAITGGPRHKPKVRLVE